MLLNMPAYNKVHNNFNILTKNEDDSGILLSL